MSSIRIAIASATVGALVSTAATALAGSGIGGVFNLGESNSVDANTRVIGTVDGNAQLTGQNGSAAASSFGVLGRMDSTSAPATSAGVRAVNLGLGHGAYGSSVDGTGVLGKHTATDGTSPGVEGDTSSTSAGAVGVLGQVTSASAHPTSAGVKGLNDHGVAVVGIGAGGGVFGLGGADFPVGFGTATGVLGKQAHGAGVRGESQTGWGVYGGHRGTGTDAGVYGVTESSSPNAVGVEGVAPYSSGAFAAGVRGKNLGTGSNGIGVWGSHAASGWGVYGTSDGGIGVNGVSTDGTGVRGASVNGFAGLFGGNVRVAGNLEVTGPYLKLQTRLGAPPGADCDSAAEAGRVAIRRDGSVNLYLCRGSAGWIGK
jgi:hypothetical protein